MEREGKGKKERTSSETLLGELDTLRRVELEGVALRVEESVVAGVEGELAREGLKERSRQWKGKKGEKGKKSNHGGDDVRGSEEVHGEAVAVVASLEVTVERGEDSCALVIPGE